MIAPKRGEIWVVQLDPVPPATGHEQAGRRPALVISSSTFNESPQGLVMILPLTRTVRDLPLHVTFTAEESGLREGGVIRCDQIRTVSTRRFRGRGPIGQASPRMRREVEFRLRAALELPETSATG